MFFNVILFAQGDRNSNAIGFLVGTVVLALLFAAFFLRGGAWLYNKFVGGTDAPSAVPEPDLGRAILISFVTMLANFGVGYLIGLVVGNESQANKLATPIGLIVNAAMISKMLPTTFARGILVTLCEGLLALIIIGGVLLVIAQFGLLRSLRG
jgi:uncharacterized membrane protein (Fun14 family)